MENFEKFPWQGEQKPSTTATGTALENNTDQQLREKAIAFCKTYFGSIGMAHDRFIDFYITACKQSLSELSEKDKEIAELKAEVEHYSDALAEWAGSREYVVAPKIKTTDYEECRATLLVNFGPENFKKRYPALINPEMGVHEMVINVTEYLMKEIERIKAEYIPKEQVEEMLGKCWDASVAFEYSRVYESLTGKTIEPEPADKQTTINNLLKPEA
jgi:uncharacterized small protein (DUF1192 family)